MEKWGFVLSHDVTRNRRTLDKKILFVIVALLFVFPLPVSAEFISEINKPLTTGLETAVFVLEKSDELSHETRKSMIEKLQESIRQSNEAYGTEPPRQ